MKRRLNDHLVQHGNHALAKLRTQINTLFSSKYLPAISIENLIQRTATRAIGVQSNTAC